MMPKPRTPAEPDAELIAICAEFTALEDERKRIADDLAVDDDRMAALWQPTLDKADVLLDRMKTMQASTAAGVHARARCLALHYGDFTYSFDCQDTRTGRLLAYLMRDAVAPASGRVV